MQRAADRCMELASAHLQQEGDSLGVSALRPEMRTAWKGTATLIYPAGATLGRHTVRAPPPPKTRPGYVSQLASAPDIATRTRGRTAAATGSCSSLLGAR